MTLFANRGAALLFDATQYDSLAAEGVIAEVVAVYDLLTNERDISPRNPIITKALQGLVAHLLQPRAPDETASILSHPRVEAVRLPLLEHLSAAESALEFHWCQHFLCRPKLDLADLREFLYWRHYEHLIQAEARALAEARHRFGMRGRGTIVFVGSGPLPFSAILLQKLTGERIVCLDAAPDCSGCAQALLARLGLSRVVTANIEGGAYDYSEASAVFIASLVTSKRTVARRIAETARNAIVAVRSVEGLRTLLYPRVDVAKLEAEGLSYVARTEPEGETINHTLFFTLAR